MMNHYLKIGQYPGTSNWDKKLNRCASVIYQYLSQEELQTATQVQKALMLDQSRDSGLRDISTYYIDIVKTLEELVEEGFAKKIQGNSLAKALAGV